MPRKTSAKRKTSASNGQSAERMSMGNATLKLEERLHREWQRWTENARAKAQNANAVTGQSHFGSRTGDATHA